MPIVIPCVNKKCKYVKSGLCDNYNGCTGYISEKPEIDIRKVLIKISIILCSIMSAIFLFMYFANKFHSMYLFNQMVCNQGLIILVVLRGRK